MNPGAAFGSFTVLASISSLASPASRRLGTVSSSGDIYLAERSIT